MHLTGGILRHFQALSTPEQNPALGVLSTPTHPPVTQTVRWLVMNIKLPIHIYHSLIMKGSFNGKEMGNCRYNLRCSASDKITLGIVFARSISKGGINGGITKSV